MNSRNLGSLFAALLLANVTPVATAELLSAPGVAVTGSGSRFWKQCSTCPNEGSSLSESAGGNGFGAADTALSNANEGYYWLSSGQLLGPNALPELKAYAEVKIAAPQIYASANATAQGLQRFNYTGSVNGSYTVAFDVNGALGGDFESIDAGVTVFSSEYDPIFEGEGKNTRLGGDRVTASASVGTGSFAKSGSVTFDVAAGQSFYVLAFLTASAFLTDLTPPLNLPGYADASHTMSVAFTAGDLSQLSLAGTVPEPTMVELMAAGLGLLWAVSRNRSRQSYG